MASPTQAPATTSGKSLIRAPLRTLYLKMRQAVPVLRYARARWALAFARKPLDYTYGFGRGLPFHRYYIERFLDEHRQDIRGHCLEFQADHYTTRFAAPDAVAKLDIIHVDDTNPRATIVADLTKPNDVAGDQFDCVVCTCTLNVLYETQALLRDIHRILKPGGVLLAAVPGLIMVNYDSHECWRFTLTSFEGLLAEAFDKNAITVQSYGNSLVAAAEMRGLAIDDLPARTRDENDDHFPVMVCARAVKR